jgi:hypothetical protein
MKTIYFNIFVQYINYCYDTNSEIEIILHYFFTYRSGFNLAEVTETS